MSPATAYVGMAEAARIYPRRSVTINDDMEDPGCIRSLYHLKGLVSKNFEYSMLSSLCWHGLSLFCH